MRAVVLSMGNTILTDEAAGMRAVEALALMQELMAQGDWPSLSRRRFFTLRRAQ